MRGPRPAALRRPPAAWTTASPPWSDGCSTTRSPCWPTRSRPCSAPRSTRAWPRRTCRCWSTACAPSASRASRSTSPTATSPRRPRVRARRHPGHVQYTRNTVTGASTAELAVLLVDARNGIVEQTRRHAAVLALLRVPRLVLAINKIDLVGLRRGRAHRDRQGLRRAGPLAGLPRRGRGDHPGLGAGRRQRRRALERTPWYEGPTLLGHLESVPVTGPEVDAPFRMPVQYVIRPRMTGTEELHDYRGYAGQVASGTVRAGRRGRRAAGRPPHDGRHGRDRRRAAASRGRARSVTVLLADDIDISRGDLLAAADAPAPVDDRARRRRCAGWPRSRCAPGAAAAQARHPDHPGDRRRDHERLDTETLSFGEPRRSCRSTTSPTSPCAPRTRCRSTTTRTSGPRASFLLIDPPTGNTLAAGLVGSHALSGRPAAGRTGRPPATRANAEPVGQLRSLTLPPVRSQPVSSATRGTSSANRGSAAARSAADTADVRPNTSGRTLCRGTPVITPGSTPRNRHTGPRSPPARRAVRGSGSAAPARAGTA